MHLRYDADSVVPTGLDGGRDVIPRVKTRGYFLPSLRDWICKRRDYVSPFEPAGSHGGLPLQGEADAR